MPIFFFYISYLQETCHCHPKLTEFFMEIGFPHAHSREKSCQQLVRHHQTQHDSMRTISDGDPPSQLFHLLVIAPGLHKLLLEIVLKLYNCFSNLMARANRGIVVRRRCSHPSPNAPGLVILCNSI